MSYQTLIENKKSYESNQLFRGIRASLPIGIGYLPIAMTFGLLAKNAGLSLFQGSMMSAFVFAGASQFVAVNMISLGIGWLEIVLTTFVLNFRHFLMSASLTQRIKINNPLLPWLIGFGITDESFSVASMEKDKILNPSYLLGLNFSSYLFWVGGTFLGFLIAGALPPLIQSSMGIALYAMFIGLLIPSVKKSAKIGLIALFSALLNVIFAQFISSGWALVSGAVLAALIGALLFKEV
ncbi:MAG: AzlC family ABC transporter permease [Clostridia bacterium]|nr:AzlC family ABC transporter permease [Clostridia bacterium]